VSTVRWRNTAGCVYSLLGEYCMLCVQSGGRILQVVSTVWWANTGSCEYSQVGEYGRL